MNNTIKINYQLELDRIIENNAKVGKMPTVLLHSCCGPCSSYVVTYLKEYFDVTVLYYNPNIYPEEEYAHRLSEQARLLKELNVPLIEIGYDHDEFLDHVRGFEAEPEGGARCEKCFELRLKKTFQLACEMGFDYFCTTLTVSPHKNAMVINKVGNDIALNSAFDATETMTECAAEAIRESIAAEYAVPSGKSMWLPGDFKKREGYKKSIELSKEYGLYRQEYCGCEFALNS